MNKEKVTYIEISFDRVNKFKDLDISNMKLGDNIMYVEQIGHRCVFVYGIVRGILHNKYGLFTNLHIEVKYKEVFRE